MDASGKSSKRGLFKMRALGYNLPCLAKQDMHAGKMKLRTRVSSQSTLREISHTQVSNQADATSHGEVINDTRVRKVDTCNAEVNFCLEPGRLGQQFLFQQTLKLMSY